MGALGPCRAASAASCLPTTPPRRHSCPCLTRPRRPPPRLQAAWKPKAVSLNIPPNTKPVRIVLEGTPLLRGMLVLTGCRCAAAVRGRGSRDPGSAAPQALAGARVRTCLLRAPRGCRLTAFGGVSWFQSWNRHPPSAAQQLAYSRVEAGGGGGEGLAAAGSGGSGAEAVALPEARVTVVDPLPLVELSVQPAEGPAGGAQESPDGLGMLPASAATPSGEPATPGAAAGGGGGGGARLLRLLQGQVYPAQLTVTNTGKVPVGWASVNIR